MAKNKQKELALENQDELSSNRLRPGTCPVESGHSSVNRLSEYNMYNIHKEPETPYDLEFSNRYIGRFDFFKRSEIELDLKKGEVVSVIEFQDGKHNVDWWLVTRRNGQNGYVPGNHLLPI